MKKGLCSRTATLVLALSMLGSVNVLGQVEPQQQDDSVIEIQDGMTVDDGLLRYTYISKIGVGLTISSKRIADIYVECKTYDYADITIKAELQRDDGSWKTIKTFTNSVSDSKICSIEETYAVTRNYEYRIKFTATVKVGSKSESETIYGNVVECYNIIFYDELENL